jgi:pyruvate,water dikinase
VAQGVFRPFTPMGMAATRALSSGVSALFGFPVATPTDGAPAFTEAGGRLFVDVTSALRSRVGRAILPRMFDFMEARSARILRGLFDDPRLSLTNSSRRRFARRLASVMVRYRVPITLVRALADPVRAERRARAEADAVLARIAPPPGAGPAERVDHVARALAEHTVPILPRILPVAAAAAPMLLLASRLLKGRATADELQVVLRGVPRNVTTEMDLELWALAQRLRRDPGAAARLRSEPPEVLARGPLPEGVREFLDTYGHRAVAEIDLGLPRWSEDPTHVLGMIANYLRLEDPALAPDALFAKGAAEAEAMITELAGRAGGRLRRRLVRFALGRARELVGVRELPKFLIVRVFAELRAQLLDVGRDLAGRGLLETADDVFFVTLAEARSGRDLREVVVSRREEYERELRRRHVPRVLLSDGTEPEAVATGEAAEGALTGTPASPGQITGVARVVLDPVGAHLEPGEILVCPSTDPGWTPLFLTAGGLVMEMGGPNSHGAVVAREYGIPAVVGVPHATARITTGQTITVDGTTGTVEILDGPEDGADVAGDAPDRAGAFTAASASGRVPEAVR